MSLACKFPPASRTSGPTSASPSIQGRCWASKARVSGNQYEKREDMKSILKPLLMVAAMAMGMTAASTLPAL
ncbi:hypothetical protein EN912_35460, partial [Mesorhizobium sp. M7A.F.Ca.CA.004.02.1.1]